MRKISILLVPTIFKIRHDAKLTEHGINWVHGHLIFRCISDQSFGVSERNIAGCGAISLIICNNFDLKIQNNVGPNVVISSNL